MNVIFFSIPGAALAATAVYSWHLYRTKCLRIASDRDAQQAAARVTELERSLVSRDQQFKTLQEQAQRLDVERERAATLLERARTDFEQLHARYTDVEASSKAAEGERHRLSAELQVAHANSAGVARSECSLKVQLAASEVERKKIQDDCTGAQAERASLQRECDSLHEQLQTQRNWVIEQTQFFEKSVLATARQLMEDRGRAITEQSKREVDAVVSPFRDQLQLFRQRVDAIYAAENTERGQLREQIVQLTSLNQAVSAQAERLTKALTVSSKVIGDWGETILKRVLEDSGLREGYEYDLQYSVHSPDGERLQLDALIRLPEGRELVVDSKVSSKAWTEYCSANDESAKRELLQKHILSLRAHIAGLSSKDYSRCPALHTVEFVLMFVPVEAALLTALAFDQSLYTEAYRRKIILVSPSTLMAVVKLVDGAWTFQRRKESADEIAEAGRKLYEKLSTFAHTFEDIGAALLRARESFEKAQGQLATGRGNAIGLAQRMLELGVTPSPGKTMPDELLKHDPESDAA